MPRTLSLACVGGVHPNKRGPGRLFEIKLCKRGDPVTLEPEPKNPYDGNAIMVLSERGVCMGYVQADRTSILHKAWELKKTVVAVFQHAEAWGAYIRVGINAEPLLPEAFEPPIRFAVPESGVDPDPGFWPDETYGE